MTTGLAQFWRSMPLRLALLLVALFTAVSLLSLAASYGFTQRSFEQAMRADLRQDLAGFRAAPNARAVAALVEAESRETDPNRMVLSYAAPSGRIYGNGAIARDEAGFHIVSLGRNRADYEGAYLSLTDRLYGGVITIARSRAEIEALGDVFRNILLISLMPTALIALSGGLVLARRSKRHVEVVGSALDRMTRGDLGARVDVGPRWSDDLAQIGGKLNQMATAQEASVTALKQVSSDIAHDLKTPLQRVALRLEDLEGKVEPGSEEGDLVARTRAEVAEMGHVFQALLQLPQVEAGAARARFAPVDLVQVCRTMIEVHEPSAEESGHDLVLEAEGDVPLVPGDRALLGQMVSNLIENALRHTPPGGRIVLHLSLQGDDRVSLRVTDTGPGIPAAEREKVLDRLYRLDRSRNTPGNGLGLSLVAAVAQLHGADLVLGDNDPGLTVDLTFRKN
ncbi:two-component sensor histidine kinase [Sulfitobacter alexandrii]|uniref:histidine kinase n=1 Tax=Sulfitobacter alexandrii TaxID=1917485 RepID=A0A1J0WE16_9RHOB|nr:ATP-binding protein [Sulfitobacter alexandrii]APE42565.1 two-component sensor histidine kinase [Sulfitobacter alexandrii]